MATSIGVNPTSSLRALKISLSDNSMPHFIGQVGQAKIAEQVIIHAYMPRKVIDKNKDSSAPWITPVLYSEPQLQISMIG
jgi:hypothetical protein